MEPIAPLSWEDLPAEVLEIVLSKVDCQEHLGPLRLVNSSWYSVINRSLQYLNIKRKYCLGDIESLGTTFTRLEKLEIYFEDEDILQKLSSIKGLTELDLNWNEIVPLSLPFGMEVDASCVHVPPPLNFQRSNLSCNGMELLTNLSVLKIRLSTDMLEPNLMGILCKLPNLKHLYLRNGYSMEDNAMEHPSVMTNLTRLGLCNFYLTNAEIPTGGSLEILSCLTNLEMLDLEELDWLGSADVIPLSSLVNLTSLHSKGLGVSRYGFDVLATLTNLTRLDLTHTGKDGDLAGLAGLSKLTHLDLSHSQVTVEGVCLLTGLVSLKAVFLKSTNVGYVIQILAPLTGLEVLNLKNTFTEQSELVGLSNLVGLKEVDVRCCGIRRKDLERASAAFPHIKSRR